MARKIGVFDVRRKCVSTYIKKSAALLLIRRLLAEWEVQNVSIRLRGIEAMVKAVPACRCTPKPKPYIPATLPSRELPGLSVKFPDRCQASKIASGVAITRNLPHADVREAIVDEMCREADERDPRDRYNARWYERA